MIYRVAYKWCGTRENAEDIAQEVCIKLGSAIRGFERKSAFSSWLYRITLNTAKDFHRKSTKQPLYNEAAVEGAVDLSENPENSAIGAELWQKVAELPENQREAVLLVYGEERSHAEVAEIMDCKENTVSWYIHEAKKQLADMLEGKK